MSHFIYLTTQESKEHGNHLILLSPFGFTGPFGKHGPIGPGLEGPPTFLLPRITFSTGGIGGPLGLKGPHFTGGIGLKGRITFSTGGIGGPLGLKGPHFTGGIGLKGPNSTGGIGGKGGLGPSRKHHNLLPGPGTHPSGGFPFHPAIIFIDKIRVKIFRIMSTNYV